MGVVMSRRSAGGPALRRSTQASWAGAFWIEYFITHLPSALSGALTWSAALVAYTGFLFVPEKAADPGPESPVAAAKSEPELVA
jgi:hypothetical protein